MNDSASTNTAPATAHQGGILGGRKKKLRTIGPGDTRWKKFEHVLLRLFYRAHGIGRTIGAKLGGHRFGCAVLDDPSDISTLVINSDRTVACDCGDQSGEAQLGSLEQASIGGVLAGERASQFRATLAKGRLPIRRCTVCQALRKVRSNAGMPPAAPKAPAKKKLHQVTLETTSYCNYSCKACMRDYIYGNRTKLTMTRVELEEILEQLQEYAIDRIALHNRGEPTLARGFADQLYLIRDRLPGVPIHFSSNGWGIESDTVREAILRCVNGLEISIDGIDQRTAEKYQVGMDFERVTRNLRNLVAYRDRHGFTRPAIYWKYVMFRWNERHSQIEKLTQLAREAGVDGVLLYPAVTPISAIPYRFWLTRKTYLERWSLTRFNRFGELLLQTKVPAYTDKLEPVPAAVG